MFEPLRRNSRPLTHFICKEMLYDYQRGVLDKDRQSAVEKYIALNPEIKKDLEVFKSALAYTENLAQTKVTDAYILELKEVKPIRKLILHKLKWSQLPEMTRWMIEGFVLSACVMLMGIVLPWEKISSLVPDFKSKFDQMNQQKNQKQLNNISVMNSPQSVNQDKSESIKQDISVTNNSEKKHVARVDNENKQVMPPANKESKVETMSVDKSVAVKSAPQVANKSVATTGFLFSMNMKMKYDLNALNLIKNKLIELGAVKAGQVVLGWRKTNPSGSYYHFSIPENKYSELIKLLEQFSTLRTYKNVHPRVMPEGLVRVILWIEDAAEKKSEGDLLLQDDAKEEVIDIKKNNTDGGVLDQEGQ